MKRSKLSFILYKSFFSQKLISIIVKGFNGERKIVAEKIYRRRERLNHEKLKGFPHFETCLILLQSNASAYIESSNTVNMRVIHPIENVNSLGIMRWLRKLHFVTKMKKEPLKHLRGTWNESCKNINVVIKRYSSFSHVNQY